MDDIIKSKTIHFHHLSLGSLCGTRRTFDILSAVGAKLEVPIRYRITSKLKITCKSLTTQREACDPTSGHALAILRLKPLGLSFLTSLVIYLFGIVLLFRCCTLAISARRNL